MYVPVSQDEIRPLKVFQIILYPIAWKFIPNQPLVLCPWWVSKVLSTGLGTVKELCVLGKCELYFQVCSWRDQCSQRWGNSNVSWPRVSWNKEFCYVFFFWTNWNQFVGSRDLQLAAEALGYSHFQLSPGHECSRYWCAEGLDHGIESFHWKLRWSRLTIWWKNHKSWSLGFLVFWGVWCKVFKEFSFDMALLHLSFV